MISIKLDTNLQPDFSLSPVRSGHVMGIVNETMANILRHARARHVRIHAEGMGGFLRIAVNDDGVGFTPGTSSGYGLRNMLDRARLLNGTLGVDTKPGKGTTVTLEIPWEDEQ
jgi:signal transduction histidine kinase